LAYRPASSRWWRCYSTFLQRPFDQLIHMWASRMLPSPSPPRAPFGENPAPGEKKNRFGADGRHTQPRVSPKKVKRNSIKALIPCAPPSPKTFPPKRWGKLAPPPKDGGPPKTCASPAHNCSRPPKPLDFPQPNKTAPPPPPLSGASLQAAVSAISPSRARGRGPTPRGGCPDRNRVDHSTRTHGLGSDTRPEEVTPSAVEQAPWEPRNGAKKNMDSPDLPYRRHTD